MYLSPHNIEAILHIHKKSYLMELEALFRSLAIASTRFEDGQDLGVGFQEGVKRNRQYIYISDSLNEKVLQGLSLDLGGRIERLLLVDEENRETISDDPRISYFAHVISCNLHQIPHQQVMTTIAKIRDRQFFGMERVMNFGAYVHQYTLSHSDQRKWFRDTLYEFVMGLGDVLGRPMGAYAQYAVEVQEEVLMNAIWDANPRLRVCDRKEPVALLPHEMVQVQWCFDGVHLGIGVRDPFGSFEPHVVGKYLKFLYCSDKRARVSVQRESAGAGIGLFMVLERLSSLMVNVAPEKMTEVIALINLTVPPKVMAKKARSFQYFCV